MFSYTIISSNLSFKVKEFKLAAVSILICNIQIIKRLYIIFFIYFFKYLIHAKKI